MSLSHLSLFSGGGGFDVGFGAQGFRCAAAIDNDPVALDNLAANLPVPVHLADLSRRLGDLPAADVYVAGPPCQGFSTLGTRNLDDPRNALLLVPAIAASLHRPRAVVIENVPGARSSRHAHHMRASAGLLRASGYQVMDLQVQMSWVGVPQRRLRAFQIAWLGGGELRIPAAAPGWVPAPALETVLAGVSPEAPNHDVKFPPPGTRDAIVATNIKPGQRISNVRNGLSCIRTWDLPGAFGPSVTPEERALLEVFVTERRRNRRRAWGDADPLTARHLGRSVGTPVARLLRSLVRKGYVRRIGGHYDLAQTFNGKYRRPDGQGLAPAVDSRFTEAASVLHPTADRAFTVRETARVQGFPDTYVLRGTLRQQTVVLANAVPPPAARTVAAALRAFLPC